MKILRPLLVILLATFALAAKLTPGGEESLTLTTTTTDKPFEFTKLDFVAKEVGCGSEGDVCAVGINGELYCHNFVENKWEHIPLSEEISGIIAVDVDDEAKIYVLTKCASFVLDCKDQWNRLPGTGRDIGVGVNFEVWKIGNDKENPDNTDPKKDNFGVWKLFCESDCNCICSRICLRFRKLTFNICEPVLKKKCHWFRAEVYGVAIDVHPNGNAAVVKADGSVWIVKASDFSSYKLDVKPSGKAVDITYSNNGVLYITLDNGHIWRYNEDILPPGEKWTEVTQATVPGFRICGTAYDHIYYTASDTDVNKQFIYTSTRFDYLN